MEGDFGPVMQDVLTGPVPSGKPNVWCGTNSVTSNDETNKTLQPTCEEGLQ